MVTGVDMSVDPLARWPDGYDCKAMHERILYRAQQGLLDAFTSGTMWLC